MHQDNNNASLLERYRIAIIAEPQLTDWFSYKQSGLVLWLTEFYTDLFMGRAFARLHRRLAPDAVLFLGDLMDGGRETTDDADYMRNRDRFLERVFGPKRTAFNHRPVVIDIEDIKRKCNTQQDDRPIIHIAKSHDQLRGEESITGHFQQIIKVPSDTMERATVKSKGRSVRHYVTGNHDVGFGNALIRKAMQRYKDEFGSVNYKIEVGKHTLVVLDTLALSSNTHPSARNRKSS
ncbi:hypothetical protein BGZ51_003119 [Haplosporangium sp. Z 767]|nr:hypothetical protein BGZ51_003119 [Haplosporangium sp. Z 767]KAF9191437.1 hypothetical protein BGZ50_009392 [Haplosporangium sp. Z 11]